MPLLELRWNIDYDVCLDSYHGFVLVLGSLQKVPYLLTHLWEFPLDAFVQYDIVSTVRLDSLLMHVAAMLMVRCGIVAML